ncbi:TetR/AcrR family transcriptional regulator [Mycobacterium spongiae]|nr:TetR/AcrR family transcriptional regulator [Mycobacterium spongiae]
MSPRPRSVSDDEILDVTRSMIRTHGPSVSTDAIGAQLGVSGQAILKRFGSRDRLLTDALRPPSPPPVFAVLINGPDDRPFADQLSEFATAAAEFFARLSQDYVALRWSTVSIGDLLAPPDGSPPAPVLGIRTLAAWLGRCTQRGLIRDVDHEAVALGLLGSLQVHALLSHVLDRPPTHHDHAAYIAVIVDTYTRALAADHSR